MYRDDFQNILRKKRPSLFTLGSFIQPRSKDADQGPLSEIWWYFSRVAKTKNSESTVDLKTCSAKRQVFGKDADQGHRGLSRTKDHILYIIYSSCCNSLSYGKIRTLYLTTKDYKGPQTNTPKKVESMYTWPAKIKSDILNSVNRILQCWSYHVKINFARHQCDTERTKTEWDCSHGQLLRYYCSSSAWRNRQRGGDLL